MITTVELTNLQKKYREAIVEDFYKSVTSVKAGKEGWSLLLDGYKLLITLRWRPVSGKTKLKFEWLMISTKEIPPEEAPDIGFIEIDELWDLLPEDLQEFLLRYMELL